MDRSPARYRLRSLRRALICAAGMLLVPTVAFAEYRISNGDILETTVVGMPELRLRAQVNQDGYIQVPLSEPLHVEGAILSEVRAKVQDLLPAKQFRRQNQDGREYPVIIQASDVDVSIAEYRPVYLNGDVAKPGEQPYRPGLTVRQAIALAGGYDILRFRMNNPFLEQSDLKSEYDILWTEYAREQVRAARLTSESQDKTEIDPDGLTGTPVARKTTDKLVQREGEILGARRGDFTKEKSYLKEAVAKEDERIAVLSEQLEKERVGVQQDAEDLQRVQEAYHNGNVPITRLVEARRSLLLSSTRQLQTAALLAQMDRERREYGRRGERLVDQRRLELLRELQDAELKLAAIGSRLEAAGEKLVYVGMVRSQLVRGKGSVPEIVVFRRTGNSASKRTAVSEDSELQPGDAIEVALSADSVPQLPAR
jgi:polysaccharide export outer membrane protein